MKTETQKAVEAFKGLHAQFKSILDLKEALEVAVNLEKLLPELEARKAALDKDIEAKTGKAAELRSAIATHSSVRAEALKALDLERQEMLRTIKSEGVAKRAEIQNEINLLSEALERAKAEHASVTDLNAKEIAGQSAELSRLRSALADLKAKFIA